MKREHHLYKLHAEYAFKGDNEQICKALQDLENASLTEIDGLIHKHDSQSSLENFNTLMKDCVETEILYYS